MKAYLEKILNFVNRDMWRINLKELPRSRYFGLRAIRIFVLALRGFAEDKCSLRASALTFYSLLSVVPVVAMAFGIAKGFGFEKNLQNLIMTELSSHQEIAERVIGFADALLTNTRGGLIAGVGILVLFWSVIKLLDNIERAFNDIWYLKRGRTWVRKLSDYLTIMLICPILLITSSSLNVFIASQMEQITARIELLGRISFVFAFFLKLSPFFFIWILFTFIYMVMPNTGVTIRGGLFGGIVAGTIFQIVQKVYIFFQVGVAKYNAIYGSFAALPLFLFWLQLSWLVVLLGAEISFATDHEEDYEFGSDDLELSDYFKRLVALRVTALCVKTFSKGDEPLDTATISQILETPVRLVREVLNNLVKARVLSQVRHNDNSKNYFQPAQDIDNLTVKTVIDMLDRHGNEDIATAHDAELDNLSAAMTAMDQLVRNSSEDVLLKNL